MPELKGFSLLDNAKWYLQYVCLPIIIYKLLDNIMYRVKQKYTLQGKVVLITGASSGLGEALAHCFYAQGCKVILAARRKEELERVKKDIVSKKLEISTFTPIVVPLDLSSLTELKSIVDNIYDKYNNIDILINNGGISNRGNVLNTDIDVDVRLMSVNYFGPVALTKAVLPRMVERKSGHIFFVSSIQGRIAIPERSAYAASKHALQAFADSLRAEVKQHNVKVSVISPSYINTSLSLNALTGTGEKHGVMDANTASGYSAEFVANKILNLIISETKELTLCPLHYKFVILIRLIIPSLYFWIMTKRVK